MSKKGPSKGQTHTKHQPEGATQQPTEKSGLQSWLTKPYTIIGIFAFVLYANTLSHDYAVDDAIVITSNIYTKQGLAGIKDIMTHDVFDGFFQQNKALVAGGRYRPLSVVTFAVEYEYFGLNPFVSHLINVLLYALSCMLIYHVLVLMLKQKEDDKFWFTIPFLAAILFTAHPIHTEVVANIKGRDEIMGMLFALLTLYTVLLYIDTKKAAYAVLSPVLFFLALLSKENAITYVAVIPLSIFYFRKEKFGSYIRILTPILIVTGVYLFIRSSFTTADFNVKSNEIFNDPFIYAGTVERYATTFLTWLLYLKLLIFPHPLTHDYYWNQIPYTTFTDYRVIAALLITFVLIYFSIKQLKSKSILSFSIAYYFITFTIVSNLLFTVGILMNERFIYLSSLGFSLAIASLVVFAVSKRKTSIVYINSALIVVLVLYSIKTISRNEAWADNFTLFTTDVKISTGSSRVLAVAAGELIKKSDIVSNKDEKNRLLNQSLEFLKRSLEINYLNHSAHILIGNAYWRLDDTDTTKAVFHYREIINRGLAGKNDAVQNMGIVFYTVGDYEKSLNMFKQLIEIKPNEIQPKIQLADSYIGLGMADSALYVLKQLATEDPDKGQAYYRIGRHLGRVMNEIDSSIVYLEKAVEYDPKNVVYWEDLGVAHGISGNHLGTIYIMHKILSLNPNYRPAYQNLVVSHKIMGNEDSAAYYERYMTAF